MRLAAIAFTAQGLALGQRMAEAVEGITLVQGFGEGRPSLRDWTAGAMAGSDGLIFIGAAGIAVRAIAPHLRGKQTDPAVVAVDEQGCFAISLLSGHVGGANDLAQRIAEATGAQPVITTATDGRGVFAVDVWAKRHGLSLMGPQAAKAVSAALLAGKPVGIVSEFPIAGLLPEGFTEGGAEVGLYIGWDGRKAPFPTTLCVVPPVLVLGIGCRKGISQEVLVAQVDAALAQLGSVRQAVCAVHTIDRKAGEPGLLALCEANGWPLRAFPAEALRAVPGTFTASRLVEETVGVDNVCERSAAITGGKLLLKKQAANGVTVAIAALPYTISFQEVQACPSQS